MAVEICGLLVSEAVREAALASWPHRPPTGYDDRTWAAACANHVALTARGMGEEPVNAELARARGDLAE